MLAHMHVCVCICIILLVIKDGQYAMHCHISHFKAVAAFQQTQIAVCITNDQILSWRLSDFQQIYEPLHGVSFKELTKLGFSSQLKIT